MGRCKFVPPEVVRIHLADVHRKKYDVLSSRGVKISKDDEPEKWRPATATELSAATAAIAEAERDGDWLDVKKALNAGETRAIFTDLVTDFQAGTPAKLDPQQVGITKALQYIVGWSLVDAHGHGVPFSASALNNLYPDAYQEIIDAIEQHDEAVEKALADRKNALSTGDTSSAT